jgi:hypothetical protein
MLLLILGGGCMMAMESMVDTVAACCFAVDSKIAFVGWGRPIALWVCLTYFAYFGLGGGVIWIAMQRGARALAGARLLLSIPAVLCTSAAANAAAGWPSWFVINGDLGPLWTQIGGLASIGIACAIVQVLATLVARPSAGRSWLATASGR